MPYSMQEFASLIKGKYPDYADVPDEELVSRVVAKHPEYKSQVALDPRSEIAFRKENQPASATGDPNGNRGLSLSDVGGAIGKGLAHFVGVPTSMDELKQHGIDAAGNVLTAGMYGGAKQAAGMVQDAMGGHVPIVGRAAEAVAAPAVAVAHDNAPTNAENLGAIESGTTLGAMAAAPIAAKAIAPSTADALAASARTQYGKALGGGAVAEEVGSQLADRGITMRNPKAQLPDVLGQDAVTLPNGMRVKGLPNAQEPAKVVDLAESGKRIAGSAAAGAGLGAAGGTHAAGVGARIGAVAGTVGEIVGVARRVMTNPLWRTTSAVVKTNLAKALRSNDFGTVADIASRVIGGMNLSDAFGHDAAVHGAVNDAMQQAGGDPKIARQILAGQEATYENPDGSAVAVPYHVIRAFINQLGLGDTAYADQRMAQGNEQGGQDQAGGATGVPAQVDPLQQDFAAAGVPNRAIYPWEQLDENQTRAVHGLPPRAARK